jgi:penicillin-binding protein 2
MSVDRLKDHWREQRMFLGRSVVAAVHRRAAGASGRVPAGGPAGRQLEHFSRLSQGNRVRLEPVPPVRGLLFDRNGTCWRRTGPSTSSSWSPSRYATSRARSPSWSSSSWCAGRPAAHPQPDQEPAPLRADHPAAPPRARKRRRASRSSGRASPASTSRPASPASTRWAGRSHVVGYVGAISESDLQRLDTANYAGTAQTGKLGAERAWEHLLARHDRLPAAAGQRSGPHTAGTGAHRRRARP